MNKMFLIVENTCKKESPIQQNAHYLIMLTVRIVPYYIPDFKLDVKLNLTEGT